MRAEALTPADIFGYHVRYVVPLFQRPYVWNQTEQWEPLWDDVRAVTESLLRPRPLAPTPAPHFLGAIVVEQAPTLVGSIQVYHVIDGQQRLTTLQLLLDAAGRVTEKYGDAQDARRLRQLVRNDPAVRRDDEAYKVWPTIGDRDAYLAAMTGKPGSADLASTPVTEAHRFFVEAITAWAYEEVTPAGEDPAHGPPDGPAEWSQGAGTHLRLHALSRAIGGYLRAVVIHLDPGDNAQGIFETLNHRGAPLLAADLIKNLVFRVAQAEGFDVVPLYQKYWADLDGPYWRAYVKRGRQVVPRIDVFVHYWLVMRLIREVRGDQIFASFRDHLNSAGPRVEELLRELAGDARRYQAIGAPAPYQPHPSVPDLFCYRVFGALDAGAVAPCYLWLMRWSSARLPTQQRDRALAALESWVVRRWLCALSTKDNNNVVLDLLRALDAAGPEQAGAVTEAFLFGQRSNSRLWPDDDLVRKALKTAALDPRVVRPRLRMLIEAIEDARRTDKSEGAPCERNLTIEHVMPHGWRSHWAPHGVEPAAAVLRDTLIHTLGNLTLVRWKLNEALANLPWTDAEATAEGLGPSGKRTELANHSRLRINAELVTVHPDAWTEQTIVARTADLTEVLLAIWRKPTEAPPPVRVPAPRWRDEFERHARVRPRVDTGFDWPDGDGPDDDDFRPDDFRPDGFGADGFGPDRDVDTVDGFDGERPDGGDGPAGEPDSGDRGSGAGARGAGGSGAGGSGAGSTGAGAPGPDALEGGAGRYARLTQFLATQTADTIPMTFQQVEDIMQDALPPSARTNIPYWSSTNVALGRAIVAGGFKPTNVDLWNERVIFARDAQARRPRRPRQHARRRSSGRQAGLDR